VLHTLLMVRYMAGRRSLGDKAIMERNTKGENSESLTSKNIGGIILLTKKPSIFVLAECCEISAKVRARKRYGTLCGRIIVNMYRAGNGLTSLLVSILPPWLGHTYSSAAWLPCDPSRLSFPTMLIEEEEPKTAFVPRQNHEIGLGHGFLSEHSHRQNFALPPHFLPRQVYLQHPPVSLPFWAAHPLGNDLALRPPLLVSLFPRLCTLLV